MPISEFYGQYQDEVINNIIDAIYRNNVAHGWFEEDRTFGDDIALLASEGTEALEEFREGRSLPWKSYTVFIKGVKLKGLTAEEVRILTGNHPDDLDLEGKPEGVGSELADILIRLLDTCKRYGIDIAAELKLKMKYNGSRPYKHGNKAL